MEIVSYWRNLCVEEKDMSKKHNLLAASLTTAVAVSVVSPTVNAETTGFKDFKKGQSHYEAVMALVDRGIITGFPDQTFRPNQELIRAHAAILFVRALQLDVPEDAEELLQHFDDVNIDSQYASFIAALKSSEIVPDVEHLFRSNDPLTREEMATWLVRAFDLQKKDDQEVPLTDLYKVAPIHRENVEILYQNGITKGKGDGSYGPKEPVTRAQFSTFFYRALSYQETKIAEVERPGDIKIDAGSTFSLPQYVNVTYGDGNESKRKVEWNDEELDITTPGIYELEGDVVGTDLTANITIIVDEVPLEFTKVETPNLKQIKIFTNHSRYDQEAITNPKNYLITDEDDDEIDVKDITVNDNEVLITLNHTIRDKVNVLVNEDILGEDTIFEVEPEDDSEPEIVDIKAISKKAIEIRFSEPIDFGVGNGEVVEDDEIEEAFEIEDGKYYIKEIKVLENGEVAQLHLYSTLDEDDYSLEIDEDVIRDYNDNELDDSRVSFEVEYDDDEPEIIEVKDVYPNRFTLVFDKEIELDNDDDIEESFHHTSRDIDAEKVFVQNRNEVVVMFNQEDLMSGEEEIIVEDDVVEDLWGNENDSFRKEVEVIEDETAPEIENVEMVHETEADGNNVQLKVTFSEPVLEDEAEDIDYYHLSDEDENYVMIKRAELVNDEENGSIDQTVLLTLGNRYGEFPDSTYTLEVNRISDLFENQNEDLQFEFEAGSEEPPQDFTGDIIYNDDNEDQVIFVVDFGEEMAESGYYSIKELDKYELTVNNTSVLLEELNNLSGLEVEIEAKNNGRFAEITIQKEDDLNEEWDNFFDDMIDMIEDEDEDDIQLTVGRVADKNNNKTKQFANHVELDLKASFEVKRDQIKAIATDTIEIQLDDQLDDFDDHDIFVYVDEDDNGEYDAGERLDVEISPVNENGKSKLVITLEDELDEDARYDHETVYVATKASVDITNQYGQELIIDHVRVEDGIVSSLAGCNV